jgi:lysophospholipase L1-like esterase
VTHPACGGDAADIGRERRRGCPPPGRPRPSINWLVDDKEDVLPDLKTLFSVAGIALVLAACSGTPDPPSTTAAPTAAATSSPAAAPSSTPTRTAPAANLPRGPYVALGDSYTAGLGVPKQTGEPAGCGRSTASYPYLVARSLKLTLTDVSCSSATTADMTTAQPTSDGTNPAQLSALSSGTGLVTVGIGGNDIGIIGIVTKCTELDLVPALIPGRTASKLTPCENFYTSGGTNQIQQRIQAVTGNLAGTLAQIRDRSPRARVYVVGYPDLLSSSGVGCGGTLGITEGDATFLNTEEVRLNAVLEQVAKAAGDGFVDTYTPSVGHGACSAPGGRWLEPLLPSSPAAPLHPNATGERGIADAVVQAVTSAG